LCRRPSLYFFDDVTLRPVEPHLDRPLSAFDRAQEAQDFVVTGIAPKQAIDARRLGKGKGNAP
jgi:hypothetical protein